jgi:hypothetical protein
VQVVRITEVSDCWRVKGRQVGVDGHYACFLNFA